eukprot:gene45141-28308_t
MHTTKFGFLKSFMPKAVAVVAEALPLAILQIWWEDPMEQCCTDRPFAPDDRCTWSNPSHLLGMPMDGGGAGTLNCTRSMTYYKPPPAGQGSCTYPEPAQLRYFPQMEEVRQVCSLFFYILPFCLTMTSAALKSSFQVTDTADVVMTQALEEGQPAGDKEKRRDDNEEEDRGAVHTEEEARVRQAVDRFSRTWGGDKEMLHELVADLGEIALDRVHHSRIDDEDGKETGGAGR